MYNWNPNVDAFASLGEQIINELAVGNAYLILNHQCESFTKIFFKLLYDVLGAFPSIPHNKIIYMVAAADAHEKYDEFVTERGIGDDKKTGITSFDHGHLTPIASDYLAKNVLLKNILNTKGSSSEISP